MNSRVTGDEEFMGLEVMRGPFLVFTHRINLRRNESEPQSLTLLLPAP